MRRRGRKEIRKRLSVIWFNMLEISSRLFRQYRVISYFEVCISLIRLGIAKEFLHGSVMEVVLAGLFLVDNL